MESKLLKVDKVATADTTGVQVHGRVIDFDDNGPLSGATVLFTRVNENMILGALTDKDGRFEKKFKPEIYNIEVRYTGKTEFFAGNIEFESGGVYDLQIGMASMRTSGN